jgi:hypothetical protein
MKDDIWHRVIKHKYIPYCSVRTWLRSTTFHLTYALHANSFISLLIGWVGARDLGILFKLVELRFRVWRILHICHKISYFS